MSDMPLQPTDRRVADEIEGMRAIRGRTPARILMGPAGPAYTTATWLSLRGDHAAAVDAVWNELDLVRDFGSALVAAHDLFLVQTVARSKREYLLHPESGRRLTESAQREVVDRCPAGADLQVVLGDGLSVAAVSRQAPNLLPLLQSGAQQTGLRWGHVFVVRYCRVGVMNVVGELLDPAVVVLLIGERPGLATAESLSAYMAYRPRTGHTDAQRNLISNIHERGVTAEDAVARILALAARMRQSSASGFMIKEDLGG